jgi:hypothetical protein
MGRYGPKTIAPPVRVASEGRRRGCDHGTSLHVGAYSLIPNSNRGRNALCPPAHRQGGYHGYPIPLDDDFRLVVEKQWQRR